MRDPQGQSGDLNGKLDEIQLAISASGDAQTRAYLEGLLGQIRSAINKRLEEQDTAGEQMPGFEFNPPDTHKRPVHQQPRPYHSAVEMAIPEETPHNAQQAPTQQVQDYSHMPLYSEWLAHHLGLKAPFEQYGFYLATALGVRAFLRRGTYARHMMRSMGEVGQAAAAAGSRWGHRYWASPASRFAGMHAHHMRTRGLAALVAYPGAWVLFRSVCNR